MTIMFWVFGVALALELILISTSFGWRARKVLMPITVVLTAFASGGIALWRPTVFSVLFLVLGLYRVFAMMRVAENRMHEQYLRRATRHSSLALLGLQALAAALWWAWARWHTTGHAAWSALA